MNVSDETKLEKNWRQQWNITAGHGQDKITKDDAIENLKQAVREPMSPGLVRSLHTQMDVNGDGQIDFHEFARACDKVLGQTTTEDI